MIDFGAVEQALQAWLARASALPTSRIIASNAHVPQPAMPYMTYRLPVPRPIDGGPDDFSSSYDSTAPAGEEVVNTLLGLREVVVSVQVFTLAAVGNVDSKGNLTARAYISAALTALGLPSIRQAFTDAGLAAINVEGVNDFSDRLGPVGQGRASLDVRFRLLDVVQDLPDGFIQTAPIGATFTP